MQSLGSASLTALWFIFQENNILLCNTAGLAKIPMTTDLINLDLKFTHPHFLGKLNGKDCFTAHITPSLIPVTVPAFMEFVPIRQSYLSLNDNFVFSMVGKAKKVLHWDKMTVFCGACGEKTQRDETKLCKVCPGCTNLLFPQVSPVVLVLVWRDDEILLARSPHFQPGIYSIIAGFVEPGETLEQAAQRETLEEVNLSLKALRYAASQPWPFPSNLMIGFTAEYDNGEIVIEKEELEDAKWFSIHALPPLPNHMSLSAQMIDAHVTARLALQNRLVS